MAEAEISKVKGEIEKMEEKLKTLMSSGNVVTLKKSYFSLANCSEFLSIDVLLCSIPYPFNFKFQSPFSSLE